MRAIRQRGVCRDENAQELVCFPLRPALPLPPVLIARQSNKPLVAYSTVRRNSPMTILSQLLCRRFGHKWSDYEFVSPGSCMKQAVCSRCGERSQLVSHEWSEWHEASKENHPCRHIRSCRRDHLHQEADIHVWTSNETEHECSRCGAKGPHEWSGESVISEARMTYDWSVVTSEVHCLQCGRIDTIQHHYG